MEQERKATEARMQEERRAMEARMEEARQRWNAERQLLIQTHQEQLATLQSMREVNAQMLSQLNLQREACEKEHLSRDLLGVSESGASEHQCHAVRRSESLPK
jgi:hypothetical protein